MVFENTKFKYGKVVTMPNLNFELEDIYINHGYKVHTIERDISVYEEQKKLIGGKYDQKLTLYNQTTLQFFSSRRTVYYDAVYLDYCGPLSPEVQTSLILSNAEIVGITLQQSRERYLRDLIMGDRLRNYIEIFKFSGYEYKDHIQYSSDKGRPMITFLLKRKPMFKC